MSVKFYPIVLFDYTLLILSWIRFNHVVPSEDPCPVPKKESCSEFSFEIDNVACSVTGKYSAIRALLRKLMASGARPTLQYASDMRFGGML